MGIAERYQRIAAEVEEACCQAGRDPAEVEVIAVSKTVGPEAVAEALAAGACSFGENRPDQLAAKAMALPGAEWHFIGNIQSRRIPDIVAHASLIHSLFEESHALKVDAAAQRLGKVQDVLLEVNVSGEASKAGATPQEAPILARAIAELSHVRLRGLMTMAPQGDLAAARECFQGLAQLAASIRLTLPEGAQGPFSELSMGMSEDWRCAIEAGATMVRVGRAIFSGAFE